MNSKDIPLVKLGIKDKFYMYLMSHIGKPYLYGKNQPGMGADCSGAVLEWLRYFGLGPGRDDTAEGIYMWCVRQERVSATGLGSLAFYGKHRGNITHVAMMIDSFRIIEFGGGDAKTLTIEDAMRDEACCRVRTLGHRRDLQAVVSLKALPWRSK